MAAVLVGGVSPEGERLIQTYLDSFMPNANIVALKPVGIKGKVKNQGSKADTVMIILDEDLYSQCVGIADAVLENPKTHKYIDDAGLKQFLISKFGVLEGIETESTVEDSTIIDEPSFNISAEQTGEPNGNSVIEEPSLIISAEQTGEPNCNSIIEEAIPVIEDFNISTVSSAKVEDEEIFNIGAINYDENTKSDDQLISELRDELIRKETLIDSLTAQLQDSSSTSEDLKDFINRIHELEAENSALKDASISSSNIDTNDYYEAIGKVAKAEKVINEFNDLRTQLNKEKENSSAIIFAKETLENNVAELNEKIALYEAQVEDAKKVREDFNRVQIELNEKSHICEELEEKIKDLSESLTDKDSLEARVEEYEGYKAQYEDTLQLLGDCEQERDSIKAQLEDSISKYDSIVEELKGVRDELQTTSQELVTKEKDLADTWKLYNDADAKIKDLEEKLSELQLTVDSSEESSGKLEAKVSDLELELEKYRSTISELNEEIDSLNKDLKASNAEIELIQISLEANKEAYDDILKEKSSLEGQLNDAESGRALLAKEIVEKDNEIAQLKSDLDNLSGDKDNVSSDLQSKLEEKDIELNHLRERIKDLDYISDEKQRLEDEILELRKTNARISSELEIKNKSEASSNSTELKLEIIKLKEQLEQANKTSDNQSEVESEELVSLRSEVEALKNKVTDLELDIVDKDEQLQEYDSNIFLKVANSSAVRGRLSAYIPLDSVAFISTFVVTCAATGESISETYDLIKRTCLKNPDKRILIVDLSSDSYVDQCMSTRDPIQPPTDWLIYGKADFKEFSVNACINGCKARVISCGISYFNTLSLLNVDWNRRLQELDGAADVIILNIGCLDNIVTKVLLNTFATIMPGHVVVKATPINLRTTILNVIGLPKCTNIVTDCVGMVSQSKEFYTRLSGKCKTNIIKPNEGMNI